MVLLDFSAPEGISPPTLNQLIIIGSVPVAVHTNSIVFHSLMLEILLG